MHFAPLLIALMLFFASLLLLVGLITQPLVGTSASRPPDVNPARLEAHVKRLSIDFYPRSYDQFSKLERAAQYIYTTFAEIGAEPSFQEVRVDGIHFRNVVARFGPASGPVVVIGAHYDSHGHAYFGGRADNSYSLQTHTPGADDNASGVAALLELARLLVQHPPNRSVELVAYTLEEPPYFRTQHMGSAVHARALKNAQREVDLMISLEMVGYFSDDPQSQAYPIAGMKLLYPAEGNFIALAGKFGDFSVMRKAKTLMTGATDLPVFSINAPTSVPGIDFSDHRSYWDEGFPALMVTDTAFYRNPNYHQAGDTYEKLDYRRMAKVVQGVFAVAQQFD